MKDNILKSKSYQFALQTIGVCRKLQDQKEFILSKQLLRSATSVGANVREANNAHSKADFIYKLSISIKECDESRYWLELLKDSLYIEQNVFENLHSEALQIHCLLTKIILSTKKIMKN
ncbi:MAG: four helix bundle protein [Crocinitomicaceae bacterium]